MSGACSFVHGARNVSGPFEDLLDLYHAGLTASPTAPAGAKFARATLALALGYRYNSRAFDYSGWGGAW